MASIAGLFFVQNPNSTFDVLGILHPYNHTILIWAITYVLVRRFYPVKPLFFIFLWGFEELAWNTVYFLARFPTSLAWGSVMASPGWDRYIFILSVISIASGYILRRRLELRWEWVAGFLLFEFVYYIIGAPIVSDAFLNSYTPVNWTWETLYNILAMALYLGMFREKTAMRHENR